MPSRTLSRIHAAGSRAWIAGLLGAAAAAVALATPARALKPFDETSTARPGFSVGASAFADFIGAKDPGPESPSGSIFVDETGFGGAVRLGYAFTPSLALVFDVTGAGHGTSRSDLSVTHAAGVLEAHYRFLPGETTRPYLFGGLGGATLSFDAGSLQSTTSGGVAVFGGGVLVDVNRHLSLDLAGRLDFINWSQVELTWNLGEGGEIRAKNPVNENGTAGKVLLGLNWHL